MSTSSVKVVLERKGSDVAWVEPSITISEAVAVLDRHGVGAVVVSTTGRDVIGILSERDVVRALSRTGPGVLDHPVSTIMSSPVETCELGTTVAEVMALMTERRFRHLPVVTDGAMIGLISIGDAVKQRVGELENDARELLDYIHAR